MPLEVRAKDVLAVELRDQTRAETVEYCVKEFAAKERVTERTVRRWIAKGAVLVRRTPGGGIRIVERRVSRDGQR